MFTSPQLWSTPLILVWTASSGSLIFCMKLLYLVIASPQTLLEVFSTVLYWQVQCFSIFVFVFTSRTQCSRYILYVYIYWTSFCLSVQLFLSILGRLCCFGCGRTMDISSYTRNSITVALQQQCCTFIHHRFSSNSSTFYLFKYVCYFVISACVDSIR